MTNVTLTAQQRTGIERIVHWFRDETRQQQVARIFGYAGCGKSTLLRYLVNELGLAPMTPGGLGGVLFAAFTGKAALVVTRKGTPAQTIHSLIYRHSEASPEEIQRVTEDLAALERDLSRMGPGERSFAEAQIAQLKLRLDHIHEPRFVLNPRSDLRDADLLVLDEVSMVGTQMATDLLAFGKPILVLGDPGQLPPVHDDGLLHREPAPDVMLTEIHRQAEDSPILRLATHGAPGPARSRLAPIDDQVWKMAQPRGEPRPDAEGRPGHLREERDPPPAEHGDEIRCRVCRRLSDREPARRSSACATGTISA
jgi:hypothetical protein